MSVKRFEEQVRDSMDELKFSPSENVWTGVVSELDKRRKRRIALWWIPIGLLLIGSVYFWNQSQVGDSNSMVQNEKTSSTENTISIDKNVPGKNPEGNSQQNLIAGADQSATISTGTSNGNVRNENSSSDVPENENSSSEKVSFNSGDHYSTENSNSNSTVKSGSISSDKSKLSIKSSVNPEAQNSTVFSSKKNRIELNGNNTDKDIRSKQVVSENLINKKSELLINENEEERSPESSSIKLNPQSSLLRGEIKSSIPLKEYQVSSASTAKSIIRNWSYGLNVAAGVAGIYDRNLIRQTDATSRNSLAFLPGNLSNIVYRSAVVEPGAFYAIGGFVERPVGRLFNLSAGLNYTRYNSKVNVGAKISQSTTIFPGTTDNQDVPFYYSPDPKGTYQMHHSMLEIPVTVRFTYKSVSANAGVTGSTLVSADMLAFDARTGVYYKEKDKLNRFQFGLTGGFDVSILKKAKYPLHIGPVFRYQVSDITSRYSDSRHLISAALQAKFYFQR